MAAHNAALVWSFGLRNPSGKYLTVEAFGSRVNANAAKMKKKQIFFLERGEKDDQVYIRTWQNKYLTVDKDGNFGASADSKGADEALTILPNEDGTWCLVDHRAQYIHGSGEKMLALIKDRLPGDNSERFTVHLAMHPQVCIRNHNRKRYLHLNTSGPAPTITCDEDCPWGDDAVLNLDFNDDGSYSIQTSQGTFLSDDGRLQPSVDESCKFMLVFHTDLLAFKSLKTGLYLTCSGGDGLTMARKRDAGKDELFLLEDSHPQIKMTSHKGQKVSIRGGIEVSANQKDTTDTETFQIECFGGKWAVLCNSIKYWSTKDDGSIRAEAESVSETEKFTIKWLDAKIALVASNGKLVSVQGNNQLKASVDLVSDSSIPDECQFVYELVNRPRLVLRGHYGFIGMLPSGVLECNKSSYETMAMHVTKGVSEIAGSNGKYLAIAEDRSKVTANGSSRTPLFLEFVDDSKFAVRYRDSSGDLFYMKGNQNGSLDFQGTDINEFTTWEF
jgi:fascin 1/2